MAKDVGQLLADLKFDRCEGTIQDYSGFDAEKDSEALRKAMKGIGTDEKAIIDITSHRSLKQRLAIAVQYKQMYGRDLKADLKSELSGDFENLTLALYTPAAALDAKLLHDAISGLGTKESVLIEILSSRSNEQLKEIRAIYKKEYKNELEKDIAGDTSGDFKRLLIALNNAARDESESVDHDKAHADAEDLYKAGEKKVGTDESVFVRILGSRSHAQLRATFTEYHKIANKDIAKSIKSEFSGDIEDALLAVVQNARCPQAYFAQELYRSMKGAGTDEAKLNRIIASRCEIDLVQIKEVFQKLYGTSLAKFIKDDTSGDYEKLLLALVK